MNEKSEASPIYMQREVCKSVDIIETEIVESKKRLEIALMCSLCFDIACSGFKAMGCGHVICKICLNKIEKCPTCQKEKIDEEMRDLF